MKQKETHLKNRFIERARRAAQFSIPIAATAVTLFGAGAGRLAVTQFFNTLGAELSGPLAFGVGVCGIAATGFDWLKHRELGAVGWGGITVGGAAALMMTGSSLLGLIPGAAGFLV